MRFVRIAAILCGVASVFLVGCGSDAGPTGLGLAGAAGVAGAGEATPVPSDGKDGVDGKDGIDGKDGANGADGDDGAKGADGKDGGDGTDGKDGSNGANGSSGSNGKTSLIRSSHELAGSNCAFAGTRFESGVDQNGDGSLSDDEVNAAQTQYVCNPAIAWDELAALPPVSTAYGFALGVNDTDGSARLGFLFNDAAYRQKLISAGGVLWDGGGVYTGAQVLGIYKLGGELGKSWLPYEGRLTPQTYQYPELTFNAGASYYTTNYPSFGGLVSVVKSGQYGAYALTPAFTTRKAHSVGFFNGQLFALIAEKTVGLRLSTFPLEKFGELNNLWSPKLVLESDATTVVDPTLVNAATTLVAAYVRSGKAYLRATTAPQTLAQLSDFPIVAQVEDAVRLSAVWDGSKLYLATLSSAGTVSVQRSTLAPGAAWETVATHLFGSTSELALAARANSVTMAVRQGGALRVYLAPGDLWPSFDTVTAGNFSLINGAAGQTLAVLDTSAGASHVLRTFQH